MDNIILSIIIPVYNVEKYLRRCVESVVRHIDDRCEVILVNDGSTDGSGDICTEYKNNIDQISLVEKENGGLGSARNAGLEVAKGRYVSFLDSDDWMEDGAYEKLLNVIKEYEPDIIGFGYNKVTDEGIISRKKQPWKDGMNLNGGADVSKTGVIPGGGADDLKTGINPGRGDNGSIIKEDIVNPRKAFSFGVIRSSCTHVFRRDLIESNKLRFQSEREILNEDYLFVTTCVLNADSYYCMDEYLYDYYLRGNSLTTSYIKEMFARKQKLLVEYRKLADEYDFSEEQRYRIDLFWLDGVYECLQNECKKAFDGRKIKEIVGNNEFRDAIRCIRMREQEKKAKVLIALFKSGNPFIIYESLKLLQVLKRLKRLK